MSKFKNGQAKSTDLLEELILQGVNESGKVPINGPTGFVEIPVGDALATLTVPANAGSALVMVQGDGTVSDATKCIRMTENDQDPTAAFGFTFGDGDYFTLSKDTMGSFSAISAEAGKTHKLFVQFYASIETD